MLNLEDLKSEFANQVFERMRQQSSLIREGMYSDTTIERLSLYIDLAKNNIPINETTYKQ